MKYIVEKNTYSQWCVFMELKDKSTVCVALFINGETGENYENALAFKECLENKGVYFEITSVSREDLKNNGFDVSNVSDDVMTELASKMADQYCEEHFVDSMNYFAYEIFKIPKL